MNLKLNIHAAPFASNRSRIWALDSPLEAVTFDIYRDIHKGIRTELFGIATHAGSLDPQDDRAVAGLHDRVGSLIKLLDSHASLEDRFLAPLLARQSGDLAKTITDDHVDLQGQIQTLFAALGELPGKTGPGRRLEAHRVYLGIASFTSDYLEHQAVEELEVMPALARGYTLEALLKVNHEMIATISPEEMAATLALILPAMNVEDRTEMFLGMKAAAPAEVYDGVRSLAQGVLPAREFAELVRRIG